MNKRLERLREDAVLGGVAAGLGAYFNIDKVIFRVLFVAGFFLPHFPSILIYSILWIVLPERAWSYVPPVKTEPSSNSYSFMNRQDDRNGNGSLIGGTFLIVLGLYFFLREWFDFYIAWGKLWPIILIGLGIWLLMKDRNRRDKNPYNDDTGSSPNPQQSL